MAPLMSYPHIPILLNEVLEPFQGSKIDLFIDGTLGAGGHAEAILKAHPEIVRFLGFDRDSDALALAKGRLACFGSKVQFIHANFRHMKNWVEKGKADGIFLDLGVSSMQLDQPERGFSFSKEGPLDMRMDPEAALDAAHVINTFPEPRLAQIFYEYGEEPRSRRAAKAIVEARRKKQILTTSDLVEVLRPVLTWRGRKGKSVNPLTLIFQALRIFVNDELNTLQEGLKEAIELLAPGGKIGVISFHSLEDRIVKNTFRDAAKNDIVTILTKKPIVPSKEEVQSNPRSRSAKLRFAEKIG